VAGQLGWAWALAMARKARTAEAGPFMLL
jgi:hypothetical protein